MVERLPFELPGPDAVNIRGVTGSADGSIVVAGNAFSGDMRRAGFVAVIPPDRKQRIVIQTEPFRAEDAVLAADGTIWAVGLAVNDPKGLSIVYGVIRRFSPTGRLLSSATISGARGHASYPTDTIELSRLLPSADRVGWFTSGCQYIEFSLDGTELARYDPPERDDEESSPRDWRQPGRPPSGRVA